MQRVKEVNLRARLDLGLELAMGFHSKSIQ